jgi:hypothetical protein
MLFSEVYSTYFNAVAEILTEALQGCLTDTRINAIIREKAFSESVLTILPAIKNEEWLILNKSLRTPIRHTPKMPLTVLQKRWLKSLLADPRIALFSPDSAGLEDVTPLYDPEDFVYFDRYADGDPYHEAAYIENFHTILAAFQQRRRVFIRFSSGKGGTLSGSFIPYSLEYSPKDDKFRLITAGGSRHATINLARITLCELRGGFADGEVLPPPKHVVPLTLELKDERNALERVMLHFSNHRKETARIGDSIYRMTLWYDSDDETEILIRILSFGPMIRVISPDSFVRQIKERLKKQIRCGLD